MTWHRCTHRLSIVLIAACGLGLSSVAAAVTFEFEGTVTELRRDGGLFGAAGTVNIGDPFTGRITFPEGPGNPDQKPGEPDLGIYVLASLEVDQSAVAITPTHLRIDHAPGVAALPPAPAIRGRDEFRALASAPTYDNFVALFLGGPFGSAFGDDSLPASLDLADFPDGALVVGLHRAGLVPNPSSQDTGVVTRLSRVPEPNALVLLAVSIGVGSAGVRARRSPR